MKENHWFASVPSSLRELSRCYAFCSDINGGYQVLDGRVDKMNNLTHHTKVVKDYPPHGWCTMVLTAYIARDKSN